MRADDGAQSELQADRNGKDDDKQDSERYTDANLENSSFSVNKNEAEIDDVLQYTAIISNSGGNYSVVSVSDLLPTTVDYVTGSLTSNLPNPISSTVNGDEIF